MLTTLLLACRSEADIVAEFCLHYEAEVRESADCREMSARLLMLIEAAPRRSYARQLCQESTACLPCKKALREQLSRCAYDTAMKALYRQLHFSKSLQESPSPENEQ